MKLHWFLFRCSPLFNTLFIYSRAVGRTSFHLGVGWFERFIYKIYLSGSNFSGSSQTLLLWWTAYTDTATSRPFGIVIPLIKLSLFVLLLNLFWKKRKKGKSKNIIKRIHQTRHRSQRGPIRNRSMSIYGYGLPHVLSLWRWTTVLTIQ